MANFDGSPRQNKLKAFNHSRWYRHALSNKGFSEFSPNGVPWSKRDDSSIKNRIVYQKIPSSWQEQLFPRS